MKIEKNEINQQKKAIILQIAVHLHEDHRKNISLHFAQLLFTKIDYTDKLKSYGSAENSGNCNLSLKQQNKTDTTTEFLYIN